jgi:hypothetical protein
LPRNPPASEAPDIERARPAIPPFELGALDQYSLYFDPYDADAVGVGGSLSDDLGDIYLDVEEGLQAWDSGDRVDAVWRWRFTFDAHWGRHAVGALGALHEACNRCPPREE